MCKYKRVEIQVNVFQALGPLHLIVGIYNTITPCTCFITSQSSQPSLYNTLVSLFFRKYLLKMS